jgi:hypothetical protein
LQNGAGHDLVRVPNQGETLFLIAFEGQGDFLGGAHAADALQKRLAGLGRLDRSLGRGFRGGGRWRYKSSLSLHRTGLLDPFAEVVGQRRVAQQSLSDFLATGDRVGSQQNQDLDLLVEGQEQASLGAFAPDELGGFPLAQGIDQASRNGLSLRAKSSSHRSASGG